MMNSSVPKIATYKYFDNTKNYETLPLEDTRLIKILKDVYIICMKEETDIVKFENMATNEEIIFKVKLKEIEKVLKGMAS